MGRAAFEDVLIEGNHVKKRRLEGIRDKCNTDIGSSGWGKNEFSKLFQRDHTKQLSGRWSATVLY